MTCHFIYMPGITIYKQNLAPEDVPEEVGNQIHLQSGVRFIYNTQGNLVDCKTHSIIGSVNQP